MDISGFFRPNFLVIKPKNTLPNIDPHGISDVIQEASSIVIFPDGNGVSFEVSSNTLEVAQPAFNPYPIMSKFTIQFNGISKIK